MTDLRLPWFGSMDDKHHPRWVRRTAVSKRGLKGSLVVVVEVVEVVTTTATPSTLDTWTKVTYACVLPFVDLGPQVPY